MLKELEIAIWILPICALSVYHFLYYLITSCRQRTLTVSVFTRFVQHGLSIFLTLLILLACNALLRGQDSSGGAMVLAFSLHF